MSERQWQQRARIIAKDGIKSGFGMMIGIVTASKGCCLYANNKRTFSENGDGIVM